MRHLTKFGWVAVVLALSAPAMAGDDSAQGFMKDRQTELSTLVRSKTSAENTKKIETTFDAILDYDAQAALRRVRVPMLWVVAGKDTEAPSRPTLEFLRALQPAPPQLDIAVFPNADHGILEEGEQHGQAYARNSAGYFDLLAHWIRNRSLAGKFGTAILQPDPMDKGSQ